MTTTALQTPFDLSSATQVGKRLFRKQILPMTEIDYKGQKIRFDRSFLSDLVSSFKKRAYDQVPFVLADRQNRHNEDPRLFRGQVKDLVLTSDGIDAVLELTADGAKLIEDNPELGVSARIIQDLSKSDGRKFGRAIRHVLATMDPRVTGMRPWQALDLSETDNIEVVDLTAETYQGRNTIMPKGKLRLGKVDAKGKTATLDLSSMSDEEFEAFLDLAGDSEEDVEIDPVTGKPKPVGDEGDDVVDPDEIEDPDDDEAVVPGTGETPPTNNPAGGPKRRKVTTEEEFPESSVVPAAVTSLSNEFAAFKADQRAKEWKTKKASLAGLGVPPFLLDLAEPHMVADPKQAIDLSNDANGLDAKATIEQMLEGFQGLVDLTPEMGHAIDLTSDIGGANDPDKALLDVWAETYGD